MTLSTILIIILILILIGALPSWGYSRSWGYGPSGGLGLIVVNVALGGGRRKPQDTTPEEPETGAGNQ